jgi:hypothetical protein
VSQRARHSARRAALLALFAASALLVSVSGGAGMPLSSAGPNGAAGTSRVATSSGFGVTTPGTGVDLVTDGVKSVTKYPSSQAGTLEKVTFYLSGLGATSGSQPVKAVVYADASGSPGALLGESTEVTVTAGQPFGWVGFAFPAQVSVPAGDVWIGFIGGSTTNLTQVAYDTVAGAARYNNASANTAGATGSIVGYAAGASDPFGPPAGARDYQYSMYAAYADPGTTGFGATTGTVLVNHHADAKGVAKFTSPQAGALGKVSFNVSGMGATSGSASLEAIVYADNSGSPGSLIGVSTPVTVNAGQGFGWVDFVFPVPVSVPAGAVWIGTAAGGTTDLAWFKEVAMSNGVRWNSASYATGPSATFGTTNTLGYRPQMWASYDVGGGGFGHAMVAPGSSGDAADNKYVSKYTSPQAGAIERTSMWLSGLGATSGSQSLNVVVYADAGGNPGALLGTSDPVTVSAGQPFSWVDFPFSTPVAVPAGDVWIGYIDGAGPSGLVQVRLVNATGGMRSNADAYADGPTDPFGPATTYNYQLQLYATYEYWDVDPAYTGPVASTTPTSGPVMSSPVGPASLTASSLASAATTTLPTWRNLYDWPNGHGYVGWHSATSAADGRYGMSTNQGGNYGLWLWPTGGKSYRYVPGNWAEWTYTAPGTTRITTLNLSFAYRNKLLAHHCLKVGLRTLDGTTIAEQSWCKPVSPPDSQSNVNVTLTDPKNNPTAKVLYIRIEMPACNPNANANGCQKNIPSLDPVKNGAMARLKLVDMTLVDDDNPLVRASGPFTALGYIAGTQAYGLDVWASDPGSGIVRNWAERIGTIGEMWGAAAPCDLTHHTDEFDARLCTKSFDAGAMIDTSTLPEGRSGFVAKSRDVAGNVGVTDPWYVFVDRTGPAAPTGISVWSYNAVTHRAVIGWTTGVDPDLPDGYQGSGATSDQYRYRVNGGAWSAWANPLDGFGTSFEVAVNPGDVVDVEARTTDAVGNQGAVGAASLQVTGSETGDAAVPGIAPPLPGTGLGAIPVDGGNTQPWSFDDADAEDVTLFGDDSGQLTQAPASFPTGSLRMPRTHRARAAATLAAGLRAAADARRLATPFPTNGACGLGTADPTSGATIDSTPRGTGSSAGVAWAEYDRCVIFTTNASTKWTIYKQCIEDRHDGTTPGIVLDRRGVGPGYIGRVSRGTTTYVDDLALRTAQNDSAIQNPGNLGAANGGLGAFEMQYVRGFAGNTIGRHKAGYPLSDPTTPSTTYPVNGIGDRNPFGWIGNRMCANRQGAGFGVYDQTISRPTASPHGIEYRMDVWLKDDTGLVTGYGPPSGGAWDTASWHPGDKTALVRISYFYRFYAQDVASLVEVTTFTDASTAAGVPFVKEPKIGLAVQLGGTYKRIQTFRSPKGTTLEAGESAIHGLTEQPGANLRTAHSSDPTRVAVRWDTGNDAAPCPAVDCVNAAVWAAQPVDGTVPDPWQTFVDPLKGLSHQRWQNGVIGLDKWALESATRPKALDHDTWSDGIVTTCKAVWPTDYTDRWGFFHPAGSLFDLRTVYPGPKPKGGYPVAVVSANSVTSNTKWPTVRRWEMGGWKPKPDAPGKTGADMPFDTSYVLFHGWEGGKGPNDCEPLTAQFGSGVHTYGTLARYSIGGSGEVARLATTALPAR